MKDSIFITRGYLSMEAAELLDATWVLLPNWKWISLGLLLFLGLTLKPIFKMLLASLRRMLLSRQREEGFFRYLFSLHLENAWAWILVSLLWIAGIDSLQLTANFDKYLKVLIQLILATNLIILMHRSVTAMGLLFQRLAERTGNGVNLQLIPFAVHSLQVLIVVLGVLVTLQNFGLNVMGLLAGLGLGGLALALAAQDTAANVFGSITILFDRPFKIGDNIKIASTEGIVESIGFRSTRIRTPYNSLISIPNSIIAKEQIDNMEARPRRRIRQVLGLLYETAPEKINSFTEEIRNLLLKNPHVDNESILVSFHNFGSISLDIQVIFHLPGIQTIQREQEISQEIFCEFIKIAKKIGVEYAYPTQTIYLKNDGVSSV